MNNAYNRLGANPVGQGIGAGRCSGVNSYLDAKEVQEIYNTKMSDIISGTKPNSSNKPRVKFYGDGVIFFFKQDKCSEYEYLGWLWALGLMNDSKYKKWCKL